VSSTVPVWRAHVHLTERDAIWVHCTGWRGVTERRVSNRTPRDLHTSQYCTVDLHIWCTSDFSNQQSSRRYYPPNCVHESESHVELKCPSGWCLMVQVCTVRVLYAGYLLAMTVVGVQLRSCDGRGDCTYRLYFYTISSRGVLYNVESVSLDIDGFTCTVFSMYLYIPHPLCSILPLPSTLRMSNVS
jgi:hypothetical protein